MLRNKIAKLARETENRISTLKINQKVCAILVAVITVVSVSIASTNIDATSTTVLAESKSSVSATQKTTENSKISYNKNSLRKVSVIKHAKTPQVVLVRETTVKKALAAAKTTVGKNDVVNHKLSAKVYDGMKIIINEVKYRNKTTTEKLTLKQFKKKYPNKSTKKLSKYGKVLVNKTVQVKYVNGKATTKTVKSMSYKAVDVKNPNKKYSSLKTVSELKPSKDFYVDKNGVPLKYSKKITGTASAYSCGTHTATGKRVKPGYIAVNPKQIPYGTKLYIRTSDGSYTYGYASAEDTGGFVAWGNTVADLFFWSESDCIKFGRRAVEIYVLD